MSTQDENKPKLSSDIEKRMNKYLAAETMPLRSSLNKPRLTYNEIDNRNSNSKLFYLKKNKNELGLSYTSTQLSNFISSNKDKENIDDTNTNVTASLKNYLNLKKDKTITSHKRYNNYIEGRAKTAQSNCSNHQSPELKPAECQSEYQPQQNVSSHQIYEKALHSHRLNSYQQKASNNTTQAENKPSRGILQEISSTLERDVIGGHGSNSQAGIEKPEVCPDTPKKVVSRKVRTEIRDSVEKEISVVKNSIQLDPTRKSTQESGVIKSYAVNTNEGLIRNYNEDRVSIILNIMQSGKQNDVKWPKSAFFGVYDGHCGSVCAEFLRDNLHKFILRDKNFPSNPKEALREGVLKAESEFFKRSIDSKGELIEKSGSCGLILLVVDEICYIANVGDSRAIMSKEGGKQAISITNDHKPCENGEKERILKAGGKVYRTQIQTISLESDKGEEYEKEEIVNGPYRVFPGRLSVSRTFGDFEAKMSKYGGNPNVVIVEPDIYEVPIDSTSDFLLLGCDGVFDKFTTEDLVGRVWETSSKKNLKGTYHEIAAGVVENIFEDTFQRKAWDNITVILVCFKNMFNSLIRAKQKLYRSEKDAQNQKIVNYYA